MPMEITNSQDVEWISVSELAKRINKTKQTAYNKIATGVYPTKEFRRGSMRGILVCVSKTKETNANEIQSE